MLVPLYRIVLFFLFCVQTTAMVRAVIFGHSYVRRVGEAYHEGRLRHRGPPELHVDFVGIGGGRVLRDFNGRDLFSKVQDVKRLRPDIVFLQVGENDLPVSEEYYVIQGIVELVKCIIHECHPFAIIVGQLIEFPAAKHLHDPCKFVNDRLKVEFAETEFRQRPFTPTRVTFWKHRIGLYGPDAAQYFTADRVHLNEKGLRKFYHSLMAEVGHRAKELILRRQGPSRYHFY